MKRLTTFAFASLIAVTGAATAAPKLERVRGTIESSDGGSVSIKTSEGKTQTVAIASSTAVVNVVKSSLDNIKDGVFIGTATKEGTDPLQAIEVVIFPASMKGTGEGHYAWDAINDTAGGGSAVKSSMTNGTVKSGSGGAKVKSSMTNATVQKSEGSGGDKTLTVSYDKDQSKTILVPAKAPIVAFEKADASVLKPGGKIFVVAVDEGGKLTAKLAGVGKDGVTPPM